MKELRISLIPNTLQLHRRTRDAVNHADHEPSLVFEPDRDDGGRQSHLSIAEHARGQNNIADVVIRPLS